MTKAQAIQTWNDATSGLDDMALAMEVLGINLEVEPSSGGVCLVCQRCEGGWPPLNADGQGRASWRCPKGCNADG
jgi:hypothetical protein